MSSSNAKTVNYIELFTFKELTKCHGEPTYEKIKRIENQCKANAQRFNTTLGGGQHKYLGLVLSPARYALLSGVPFERPLYPPPLEIPAGTTAAIATALKEQHTEQKRLYDECDGIENALKQQILNAFDHDYLADLIDRDTQSITSNISEIFTHLYTAYGRISLAEFHERQKAIEDEALDLQVPLTVLWNKIDDLKDLAEHIHAPISEQQCINIALRKLINTQTFTEEIKKWKTLNQTWAIFKQHFRQAQQDLRDLGGLQMQQTQIFQANLVNEVIEGVQALLDSHHVPPAEHQEQAPPDPAANAIIPPANPVIDQNLMQNFQMFMQLQNLMNPPRGGRGGRGNRGRGGRGGRGDRPRIVHSYCWTHGACSHNGHQCRNPAVGHQKTATFENKMNGSIANYPASQNSSA